MAFSGLLLFGFVVAHMLGNLQMFLGPDAINAYGAFLKSKPGLLWGARLGLLFIAAVHITTAIQVSRENKAARPIPYGTYNPTVASYASQTMLMSGLIVFAFLIYHLLHFTVCASQINFLNPSTDFHELRDSEGRHDIYRMLLLGFSNVWVSGFYIVANILLCMHLKHGLTSMFQSMGWRHKTYGSCINRFACIATLIILFGNVGMPVAVLLDRHFHLIPIFK